MFSGIIKCVGKVESVEDKGSNKVITISSPISDTFKPDQSIAHNGVCLTIVRVDNGKHVVDVVNETLSKSSLGQLKEGHGINLEKSITPASLLDGHLVQGHVDTTLKCVNIVDLGGSWKIQFNLPDDYAALIIPQGSICINGVSLTVSDISADTFSVSIIPHTFENTTFKHLHPGDFVNAEFDLIGKYIIRQMELRSITE